MSKEASTLLSGDKRMSLSKAILIYGDNNTSSYATIHDIKIDAADGRSSLKQGVPLDLLAITQIMKGLGESEHIGAYLPPHILSAGHNSVVWWLKPATRRVHFRCTGEKGGIGEESAEMPQPGLVFAVKEQSWSVFAVKGCERPDADTPLYLSPYFNVSSSGAICIGTANVPRDYSAASTSLWDKAFFESAFSHPNVHPPLKLVKYRGGSYKFWRHMLDGKFKEFPENVLVSAGQTVEQFIKSVNGGSR